MPGKLYCSSLLTKNIEQSEKFNVKAKREEMETMKKNIKDKLISLNNKSKTIESLLEEGNIPSKKTAFNTYRGVFPRTQRGAHEGLTKLARKLAGVNKKEDFSGTSYVSKSILSNIKQYSKLTEKTTELFTIKDTELLHKTNNSTADLFALVPKLINSKEKENKRNKNEITLKTSKSQVGQIRREALESTFLYHRPKNAR